MKFIEIFAVVSIVFTMLSLGAISFFVAENEKYAEFASHPLTEEEMNTYAEGIGRVFIPKLKRFSRNTQAIDEICCGSDSH